MQAQAVRLAHGQTLHAPPRSGRGLTLMMLVVKPKPRVRLAAMSAWVRVCLRSSQARGDQARRACWKRAAHALCCMGACAPTRPSSHVQPQALPPPHRLTCWPSHRGRRAWATGGSSRTTGLQQAGGRGAGQTQTLMILGGACAGAVPGSGRTPHVATLRTGVLSGAGTHSSTPRCRPAGRSSRVAARAEPRPWAPHPRATHRS